MYDLAQWNSLAFCLREGLLPDKSHHFSLCYRRAFLYLTFLHLAFAANLGFALNGFSFYRKTKCFFAIITGSNDTPRLGMTELSYIDVLFYGLERLHQHVNCLHMAHLLSVATLTQHPKAGILCHSILSGLHQAVRRTVSFDRKKAYSANCRPFYFIL